MLAEFECDQSADAVTEHDCVATNSIERFARQRGQIVEAKFLERRRRDAELMPYYKASVRVSRELPLDEGSRLAHRAANREQWAADEMIKFSQMLTPRGAFPSFRFARLMAAASRAA